MTSFFLDLFLDPVFHKLAQFSNFVGHSIQHIGAGMLLCQGHIKKADFLNEIASFILFCSSYHFLFVLWNLFITCEKDKYGKQITGYHEHK